MAEDFFLSLKVPEGLDLWRVPVCPQHARKGQCEIEEDPSPAEFMSSAAPGSHHQGFFLCPWRMIMFYGWRLSALAPCLIKTLFWGMKTLNDFPPGFAELGPAYLYNFPVKSCYSNLGLLISLLLTDSKCWIMLFDHYASMRFPLLLLFLFSQKTKINK